MNRKSLLVGLFLLETVLIAVGSYLMIVHRYRATGNGFLIASFMVALVLVIAIISEVTQSRSIKTGEKILWALGIIFMHFIVALIYLLVGRNHVVKSNNLERQ